MKFCWVTLHVSDFNRSFEFYNGILGLQVTSGHKNEHMEMVMLGEENQPQIEILYTGHNEEKKMHSDISVGVSVESLDETMEYLKEKGIPIIRGPIMPNPHTRFAFVQDPDGYEVQLVEMKG